MASQRTTFATVVLATNSPLYAPILLAQAERINSTCAKMRLELAAYPSSFRVGPNDVDPFIDRILSQKNVDTEILFGIGDPMRITAVPVGLGKHAHPKIIGGLLQKMCYWLVDSREFTPSRNGWEDAFERVLVHPRGMTGFTVPCYDFHVRSPSANLPQFVERLLDDTDPNDERGCYDRLNFGVQNAKKSVSKPFAFVTMNPLHASQASAFAKNYTMVKSFIEQEHFCDAIMTGIIVARDIADSQGGLEQVLIGEFKEGIATAIEYILNDPFLAACRLWRAQEEGKVKIYDGDGLLVPPFFVEWSPDDLAEALRILSKARAFNLSPTLSIKKSQWEKTKIMRGVVEPVLTDMEKRQSVNELAEDACEYG